jgi:hypothetical protein
LKLKSVETRNRPKSRNMKAQIVCVETKRPKSRTKTTQGREETKKKVTTEDSQAMDAVTFAREKLNFFPDPLQIKVLDESVHQGLLNCTRQWGKSTTTAAKVLHRAWSRPGSLVLVVSPSARQTGEFIRKVEGFVSKLGIKPRGDGDNRMSILLPNQSRIVGLPGSEGTTRGFSAVSLLVVDEASRVDDNLYRALRPSLAVSGGDLWLMSTPWGKEGFFYREWALGGDDWLRIRVPATECPRIPKEFLERERQSMGEAWFKQEYMCEFLQRESSFISTELAEGAKRHGEKPLQLR